MKFFERTHTYNSDFDTVTAAWFVKYNTTASSAIQHVKEIHTLDRKVEWTPDCSVRKLSLRRLFYLEYGIPRWIEKMMRRRMEGYALEEVEVVIDAKDKTKRSLRAVGRNLTFSGIFAMEEVIEYRPDEHEPDTKTTFTQKMKFKVAGGIQLLGDKLESAARDSAEQKSAQGLHVMEKVIAQLETQSVRINEDLMNSFTFHPDKDTRE